MNCSSLPSLFPAALISLAVAAPAFAQLSPWASLPAAGATPQLEQSIVVVPQGNTVAAFSALTKTWAAVTGVFGTPTRTLLNEHLIVRDGPFLHGFSPRTGAFATLLASNGATFVGTSSPQTFSTALVDGNRLYVFFAFSGQWQVYSFAAPPAVRMGRFCMLVDDGTSTWAISDFYGTLVQAPAGALPLRTDGNMAFAFGNGMVHGFGAGSNAWSSTPMAAAPTIAIGNTQPTCAALTDGSTIALFSGHTGTFTVLPVAPTAQVSLQRELAIVVDGPFVYGYSGLLGTSASMLTANPPTVTIEQMFGLIDDGNGVHAYSATTGTFATPFVNPAAVIETRAQIAIARSNGDVVAAYSSLRNTWDAVPAMPGAASYANAVALVLVDPSGVAIGWSMRGGGFVAATTGAIDTVAVGTCPPNTPETIWLRSGTTMWTFNPRTERWRSVATNGPATLVRAHYLTILAQDGSSAYAFDIWNDSWSVEPLPNGYLTGSGQVQSAYVSDGVFVHAYGGIGQLSMVGEFPDFYRAASAGLPLRQDITAEPGSIVLLAASLAPANIPLPFGDLLLDPSTLVLQLLASTPPSGVLSWTQIVPAGFTGAAIHYQAGVFGPHGLYLTNSVFPLFL